VCESGSKQFAWHYSVFARASLSTFGVHLLRKEPSNIRALITFRHVGNVTICRHEVNDIPTRLALAVMTQEQDKAEGVNPSRVLGNRRLPIQLMPLDHMAVTGLPKNDIWSVCLRLDTSTQKNAYTSKDERSNKDNCALEAVRAVSGRADRTEMLRNW
jgi:hypothetical protein